MNDLAPPVPPSHTSWKLPAGQDWTMPGANDNVPHSAADAVETGKQCAAALIDVLRNRVVGNGRAVEMSVLALAVRGHLLLEDVPGTGKTTLAKTLANASGLTMTRISCTPDLLPGDITGVSVFHPGEARFEFRPGPVFTNILLADELNRATPKAQSALLEAMAERCVSVDGTTMALPKPFLVVATMNPIDFEGTYQLPEAQLDRFALSSTIGYPTRTQTIEMLRKQRSGDTSPTTVLTPGQVEMLAAGSDAVNVDDKLLDYICRIVEATRTHRDVLLGASPRAAIDLSRCAAGWAMMRGRHYANADDVKAVAVHCLAHRLVLRPGAARSNVTGGVVVAAVVANEPVPSV